jgi:hypothetical protein
MARDDTWSNVLVCSGFELYGELRDETPKSLFKRLSDFVSGKSRKERHDDDDGEHTS